MHKVILLLGGNLGNIKATLESATQMISNKFGPIKKSSNLYESEPWGFEHAQNFINQVIEIETSSSPNEILVATQNIEKDLGRKQKTSTNYEGRLIDIDILFIDDLQINEADLVVPHPKLHERLFTLLPLCEKWNYMLHPSLNKSIEELTEECKDTCWARLLK